MKNLILLGALALAPRHATVAEQTAALSAEILHHGKAYDDLAELTGMGSRLAGSADADRAIAWAKSKMEAYGFEAVRLQPMTTPVWTRGGAAVARVTDGAGAADLRIAALGGSIGTPAGGLDAGVVEVHSLDEVASLGAAVRGKIVFYNRPMDPTLADTFAAYGGAIDQRTGGASQAARYGAVGVLVRTLTTLPDDDHPHTGALYYTSASARIPAAAVSTHGANELSSRLAADPALRLHFELASAPHGTKGSFNVLGEIKGSDKPDEVVVIGGHLDSWDLGPGAHDDGAGVVQSLEALRAMKSLGLKPKRTIRVVLWMAEEFGGYGANDYAAAARTSGERHIAAIESDRGGFAPVGFTTDSGPEAVRKLQAFAPLLAPLHADQIGDGESGTDVAPLSSLGAVTIGYLPVSTHYFDYHHSETDVLSAVDPAELLGGAAAMATLAWSIADAGL